jgi:holo-[acyl-carrier protein] synthase
MSILGHGIDLVAIAELQRWIDDPRDPFTKRCFRQSEIAAIGNGPNRVERLAGRFAAKEAVLKALGIGLGDGVAFSDVEIIQKNFGPPEVALHGGAAAVAADRGVVSWFLSISHESGMAVASAIACGETPARR